jgi:toxin-antitoxin system PIN domain toxin
MILVDVNLLVFAQNADSPFHRIAKEWWDSELRAKSPIAIAWLTVVAFIRLSTSPQVMSNPLSTAASTAQMNNWLSLPNIQIANPGAKHWTIFHDLINRHKLTGSSVTDAHLAALAIEHGWQLCTADHGFSRFQALRWRNPILGADV